MVRQHKEELILDINGQIERVNRLYTQLTFCYKRTPSCTASTIGSTLRYGLSKLYESFPWTAGRVFRRRDGLFVVGVPELEDFGSVTESQLTIKDRPDMSFATLLKSDFSASLLHEDDLAPCSTLLADVPEAGRPVLLVQAVLTDGGLLLTIAAQHGCMDMAGFAEVVRLLSKACKGESFTAEEVQVGNMHRDWWLKEHASDTGAVGADERPGETTHGQSDRGTADLKWALVTFSSSALAAVKQSAMADISEGFVSTDDALSALIWQAVTRACAPDFSLTTGSSTITPSNTQKTSLSRNVDLRRHLTPPLPLAYSGFVTESTTHTTDIAKLLDCSRGRVAQMLREALRSENLRQQFHRKISTFPTHAAATQAPSATCSMPIKGAATATQSTSDTHQRDVEVRLSSWSSQQSTYTFAFGLGLGEPLAVRRPSFVEGAREGLVYFLPKDERTGSIEVMVCLEKESMARLWEQFNEQNMETSAAGGRWLG